MNVWEQKRKEREQQRANAFGSQSSGNNGPQGPIVINGNAQQMNPSALGINISSKPVVQQQASQVSNSTQQQQFSQPQQQYQPYQAQQQQPPPQYNQQSHDNNKQQAKAPVQKYVDFEPSLPSNTREKEMDRYEKGARPLDFTSSQPKPKQITEGDPELFANPAKKKPSEMNDEEYAEYEKRQIRNQQMRLIKSVVWNPKASNFDKREVDELLKVDAVFKKMYEEELRKKQDQEKQVEEERLAEQRRNEEKERRQAELDRKKDEPQTPSARQPNMQQQQFNNNYQYTPPQQQQMYGSGASHSGMYDPNMNNAPYGGYGNMQPSMQPQGGFGGGSGYYQPQQQYGGNSGYNGYGGYQQQQNSYGAPPNRQYYQNANAPSERDFFQLQDEVKMLREQLRRYELDNQQNDKVIRDLQYQLSEEKRIRQQTERALLDAQRDMEKYTAEIGAFQRSLKEGKPYNPQLPQMPQGGYMTKYQQGQQQQQQQPQSYQNVRQYGGYAQNNLKDVQQRLPQQQFAAPSQPSQIGQPSQASQIVNNILNSGAAKISNRPGSGTVPQILPNQLNAPQSPNQVDKLLNKANEILDAYPAGAQTIARVKSRSDGLTQQGASSNMIGSGDACMRTLQADSSLIEGSQTMKRQQDAELQRLLNQDDNYNTMQMERPPEDVPPSLLESIEPIQNRLPSAKYQPGGFK